MKLEQAINKTIRPISVWVVCGFLWDATTKMYSRHPMSTDTVHRLLNNELDSVEQTPRCIRAVLGGIAGFMASFCLPDAGTLCVN